MTIMLKKIQKFLAKTKVPLNNCLPGRVYILLKRICNGECNFQNVVYNKSAIRYLPEHTNVEICNFFETRRFFKTLGRVVRKLVNVNPGLNVN